MKRRAIIAMSGGVDFSVAAFLMERQGNDCIGGTMEQEQLAHTCFPPGILTIRDISLIPASRMDAPMRMTVKLRSRQKERWATARKAADDLEIRCDSSRRASGKGAGRGAV